MSVSRRSFVRTVGAGSAGLLTLPWVTARGAEALADAPSAPAGLSPFEHDGDADGRRLVAAALRLDSNENPYGPAPAVLEAVRAAFGEAGRYAYAPPETLRGAIGAANGGLPKEQVVLGVGSAEVLRMAVLAFASASKPLVVAVPTYEAPARTAALFGFPVRAVPVRDDLSLDLDAFAGASRGAGLVFLCNPNNPTGLVHDRATLEAFIGRLRRESPDTTIVVDEAYHEYVDDPRYATSAPLAAVDPRVVVTRTFSKVYGMAGLRVGYALGTVDTIAAMRRHALALGLSQLGLAAGIAAVAQPASYLAAQRALNHAAREYTADWFRAQRYAVLPGSQTNFIVVDVRRDVTAFQSACRDAGVLVGRPFPGMPTRARISIGTMDEMRQATDAFRQVLQAV